MGNSSAVYYRQKRPTWLEPSFHWTAPSLEPTFRYILDLGLPLSCFSKSPEPSTRRKPQGDNPSIAFEGFRVSDECLIANTSVSHSNPFYCDDNGQSPRVILPSIQQHPSITVLPCQNWLSLISALHCGSYQWTLHKISCLQRSVANTRSWLYDAEYYILSRLSSILLRCERA